MSLPEILIWAELKKRPGGYRFRKQVPQHPFTLDFACLSARLAIEVDGALHDRGDRPQTDATRDHVMAKRGFQTLRLRATDVLKNLEGCVQAIVTACSERATPPPSLRDGPPPRPGEEFKDVP